MPIPLFVVFLIVVAAGLYPFAAFFRASGGRTAGVEDIPTGGTARYLPMFRLLAPEDLELTAKHPALHRKLQAQRRDLFRAYVRCLTKDYARLIGGLRFVLVHSDVERPDLVRAIRHSHRAFALALYKVEIRLRLQALGFGHVDVSDLMAALEALRGQAAFIAAPAAA